MTCSFFAACNEPSDIGLAIQPPQDKINVLVSDSTSLVTYTVREDSIRSDETSLALLGSYADPVFGISTAGFYTQVRLSSSNVNFGANPVIDSVILSLAYNGGYYGDISFSQTVKVFELTERIYRDSSYYSDDAFSVNGTDLANNYQFTPKPEDSVTVLGTVLEPHLRIPLVNTLGQQILDESGSANLADNNAFVEYFKGLYVTVDNPGQNTDEGAILYFNLLSTLSNVTLYYHTDDNDSLSYDLEINSSGARINHFSHDYTGTTVYDHFSGTAADTNLVYVQAMSGVKTKITMPHLENWNNAGNIAINKAEMIIHTEPGSDNVYEAPSRLLLVGIDSAGNNIFLIDQLIDPEGIYYGGFYDEDRNEYRFNIARHIQAILNGKTKDYGLYLLASGSAVNARRTILTGASNPAMSMRLRISYTVF